MSVAAWATMFNADMDAHKQMSQAELPPHFPQPNADPIALLEAALAEKDEAIAFLFAEAKGWQGQLDAALTRISELEANGSPQQIELIRILERRLENAKRYNTDLFNLKQNLSPRTLKKAMRGNKGIWSPDNVNGDAALTRIKELEAK